MSTELEFERLVEGLRTGDPAAVSECVEKYEAEIRRAARVRLRDPQLRRLVDSIDITQSVFRRFLTHCKDSAYVIDRPEQLLALLVTMTRNRVTDWARKRRVEQHLSYSEWMTDEDIHGRSAARAEDPTIILENRELADVIRGKMLPLEYKIFCRRADGDSWELIGRSFGQSPEALRKRLQRGLARVRTELRADLAECEGKPSGDEGV